MDRRSTVELESTDLAPEKVAQLDGAWAFPLAGFVYVSRRYPRYYFTLVACSRSWMASEGWNDPPVLWSLTWGPSYLFPWGLLVMADKSSWNDIERAVGDIVARCDGAAGDDGDRFMRLMSRFVVWDDDEFRDRDLAEGGLPIQ